VTFWSYQKGGLLSSDQGYANDLWTSSVCAFTSLVITVNLNLIVRMKYLTWVHAVGYSLFSLASYMSFMWFTNFSSFAWTQHSVLEAHSSGPFYLIVTFCVGASVMIDFAFETSSVLIFTTPVSFLRQVASRRCSIDSPGFK